MTTFSHLHGFTGLFLATLYGGALRLDSLLTLFNTSTTTALHTESNYRNKKRVRMAQRQPELYE